MQQVILATGNPGKLLELQALLAPTGWQILAKPASLEIEETGSTFQENAHLKALQVAKVTGHWALADDSGLEVDALGGAPGVYSARYGSDDADRIARLLAALKETTMRTARFVCVLAIASPQKVILSVEGICDGEILDAQRGGGGFGYDPIFWVPELGKSFAELSTAEKSLHSHRGKAMAALREAVLKLATDEANA
ncbi:MAG: RdgB/HAM1 family non-canonical purine NTP pyrophosphatase [Anaerolineae bacterium]|nr:RdgB/HAM1 family non-canonical purine NTP pyrophosphatase [Gloeobacterales cyanobacterium ES-bin-313]